jgi:TetR/AcrR family transcriptional repressor of nem operon
MGCPLPALAVEVARADDDTKQIFEALMLQLKDQLQSPLTNEDDAWAVITQAVGAVVIARAMTQGPARKSLLKASRAAIEKVSSDTAR